MLEKLKPCPFCGSTNIEDCYVYYKCLDCSVEGPKMNNGNNDDHADFIDHENALKAWNKRKDTGFLPKELTAKNGAKTLLRGEFIEQIELHDFEDDEVYTHNVPVSWTTIKEIYKKIVKHYQGNLKCQKNKH